MALVEGPSPYLCDCENFANAIGLFAALCTRQPQGRMHADSMNTHFLFWSPFYTIYLFRIQYCRLNHFNYSLHLDGK